MRVRIAGHTTRIHDAALTTPQRGRTPEYFEGYRHGHADSVAGLPANPVTLSTGWLEASLQYADGYRRGYIAGGATVAYGATR